MPSSPQRGLGISVSPRRVPLQRVRAPDDGLSTPSIFADATMVTERPGVAQNSPQAARAQKPPSKLSEPFLTPEFGTKDEVDTPSSTYSSSISPSFVVRNLDDDPHTGNTPTTQSFEPKKTSQATSRLSKTLQLPSPPSTPDTSPVTTRSRLPRRSKDDLSLTESSRKLQAVSATRPRRISIPTPLSLDNVAKLQAEMTVALAPPAPIMIPPNEYPHGYPSLDKPLPSAKSPSGLASLFRWNTVPANSSDQLITPATLTPPPVSPMTPTSPSTSALEQELRSVSADLAFSIRREMDLEDVITRLQEEISRFGGEGKRHTRFRTSDYFSETNGSPTVSPMDELDRKKRGHSRGSSVALEDIRMANEKVTQLEKEVLVLKRDNLDLMTAKREAEKKIKEQKASRDLKKMQELEANVDQLRQELIEKTRTIEVLEKTNRTNNRGKGDTRDEEIKKLTEQARGAESQRDALQLALRQLRERQSLEAKKMADRIRQLESEKEKVQRHLPRTPERAVTGITHRPPEKRNTMVPKDVDAKVAQLKLDLAQSSRQIADITVQNTQLSTQNTQLRDMQQRLQARLNQLEATSSASTISEASAAASLSHAHRLAVEMARVTDFHMKSLEKVRTSAQTNQPFLKGGGPLSPMLRSSYDTSLKPDHRISRMSLQRIGEKPGEDPTVKMMEERIKELEGALQLSSDEMGEVVRKMQNAQIEMIELASERDEAMRRERKLQAEVKTEMDNMGIPVQV
jgi:hypothetical protein